MATRQIVSYDDITLPYDNQPPKKRKRNNKSQELTHQEIWDDSALVDAWDSAQKEYEMHHGKDKDWKNTPVKKSPLWYNIPMDQPTTELAPASLGEHTSHPLNFETFVPTHDPSLQENYTPDTPAGPMVSQDEAFSRAMNAMYWSGYWTAMYHCQRKISSPKQEEEEIVDDDDEFVSTER